MKDALRVIVKGRYWQIAGYAIGEYIFNPFHNTWISVMPRQHNSLEQSRVSVLPNLTSLIGSQYSGIKVV